jgi:hypothetical protein
MRNQLVFWGIFLLIIVAETYGYVSVRTALAPGSPAGRRGLAASYWALTLGLWALCFWAARTRHDGPVALKTYLLAAPLLLLAAKLVIVFPLLLEDLTRLGRWAVQGVAAAGAALGHGKG